MSLGAECEGELKGFADRVKILAFWYSACFVLNDQIFICDINNSSADPFSLGGLVSSRRSAGLVCVQRTGLLGSWALSSRL